VRLFEFQGKDLFRKYGIPVPRSRLVRGVEDVDDASDWVGLPAVVKAQVLSGGRGKAGGVAIVRTKEEARFEAARIFGLRIGGERPSALLIESALTHLREMYLSVSLDRGRRSFVVIASGAGGIDVEAQAGRVIEAVPVSGLPRETAIAVASRLGIRDERGQAPLVDILLKLERLSREEECELAEINPLAVDAAGGSPIALDSKVVLDDNALFRHPELALLPPEDPMEGEAAKEGFAFVRLDGDIAVVGNGAGLVLSTLDLVSDAGGRPACFLDLGGGSQQDRVEAALRLVRRLPNARRVLVNIFGGITRTTDVAAGVKKVVMEAPMQPVYARISGAEEEEARRMLQGTPVRLYPSAPEAVEAVVGGA
jgi:succinyl-CoA synthetase beta subunit